MAKREHIREWLALLLGAVGTIAGCLSLWLLWQQHATEQENLAISTNLIRSGYPSFIKKFPSPLLAGTLETRWQVWVTNLSSREVTIVGDEIFLVFPEKGRVSYSGLFVRWEQNGNAFHPYPIKLDPGDVLKATLVVRYPLEENAVQFALQNAAGDQIAIGDIDSFISELITTTNRDIFGNEVNVKEFDGNVLLWSPNIQRDIFLGAKFITARRNQFEGFSSWYKLYDPTK